MFYIVILCYNNIFQALDLHVRIENLLKYVIILQLKKKIRSPK